MKKKNWLICLSLLFLTGCWDQNPLQKNVLILGAALDKKGKNSVLTTVVVRNNTQSTGGQSVPENFTMAASGDNLKDSRLKIDKKTVGNYSPNKIRIILLGEELAKEDISPYIDSYLRDPKVTIAAKVAVVKGEASNILKEKKYQNKLIADALTEQLESAERNSSVPMENQQTIKNKISDEGKDFALPYLEKNGQTIGIAGLALFHGAQFTGVTLKNYEPEWLILLQGKKESDSRITQKYPDGDSIRNYVSFSVKKFTRKMKINIQNGKPVVTLNTKMFIELSDFARDRVRNKKELDAFNRVMSRQSEKEMNNVIHTLQKANCDALGIARKLIAYHPATWKKLNWEKEYPTIPIKIHVEVKTVNRGLIY